MAGLKSWHPLLIVAPAALGFAATTANSEERQTPAIGESVRATAGTPIWEHYRFDGVEGVTIDEPIQARWGSVEEVNLVAGSGLFIIRERKLKACRDRVTYSGLPGAPSVWANCVVDSEDDGRFDKVIYSSDGLAKRIDPPVAYALALVEGNDLRPWHNRTEWRAKTQTGSRRLPVKTYNSRQVTFFNMANTAWDTTQNANGQQVTRTVKNKDFDFADRDDLARYIADLFEAQEGLCAITGLRQ